MFFFLFFLNIISTYKWSLLIQGASYYNSTPQNTLYDTIYHTFNSTFSLYNHPDGIVYPNTVSSQFSLFCYGGQTTDSSAETHRTRVLWEFSTLKRQWRWVNTNWPGNGSVLMSGYEGSFNESYGRENYPSWIDGGVFWNYNDERLILYSGEGYKQGSTSLSYLNTMWEYSMELEQWRWVDYSHGYNPDVQKTGSTVGVYHEYESEENRPPNRKFACGVKNNVEDELHYMFGGGKTGYVGYMDLWYFNTSSMLWKYLRTFYDSDIQQDSYEDSNIANETHYDQRNYPGGRSTHGCWMKGDKLWLFGGSVDNDGWTNDFWVYDVNRNQWKCINQGDSVPVYDNYPYSYFKSDYRPTNLPTARQAITYHTAMRGNRLYLMGGSGITVAGYEHQRLNDLWEFDTLIEMWRYVPIAGNMTKGINRYPSYTEPLHPPTLVGASLTTIPNNEMIIYFGGIGRGFSSENAQFATMWNLVVDYSCYNKTYNDDGVVCNGHGSCTEPDVCICIDDHQGDMCQCSPAHCNHHGVCVGMSFECLCNDEYFNETGGHCERPICYDYPSGDSMTCNEHGDCVDPEVCECHNNDHWYGISCEEEIKGAEFKLNTYVHVGYKIPSRFLDEYQMNTSFPCKRIIEDPSIMGSLVSTDEKRCEFVGDELLILVDVGNSCLFLEKNHSRNITIIPVTKPNKRVVVTIIGDLKFSEDDPTLLDLIEEYIMIVVGVVAVFLLFFSISVLLIALGFIKKYRTLKVKQDKIEDLDLIIKEEELSKKEHSVSFNVDKSLFSIPTSDLKLIEEIGGGGGDAKVYKVNWKGNISAFKLFKSSSFTHQDSFDEFQREVTLMSSLHHPNILQFYGCSIQQPRIGIVMEFCSKGHLLKFFNGGEGSDYSIDDRLKILGGVVLGMEYLHDRDLKLENILLDDNTFPKIMDFGISKIVKSNEKHTRRIGTVMFMAPEVVVGTGKYNNKCDVYSFSIVCYICLTFNFKPYGSNINNSIDIKAATDPTYRPIFEKEDEYPEWIVKLIKKSWNHQADERPSFNDIKKIMEHENVIG